MGHPVYSHTTNFDGAMESAAISIVRPAKGQSKNNTSPSFDDAYLRFFFFFFISVGSKVPFFFYFPIRCGAQARDDVYSK